MKRDLTHAREIVQHKDAASFTAVTQNLRGLTTKKLEIIIKNMEDKAVDITVLQETWNLTPTGVAIEELGNAANLAASLQGAQQPPATENLRETNVELREENPKTSPENLINTFCGAP